MPVNLTQDCPAGLYGNSCSYKCPNGQYGVRCSSECKCSGNQICDRVEGCKLKTRFWKALVTNGEGKEKSTRYSTEIQPTRRPSTSIEEGTSDIDTVVLYRSQNREEKTSVVYVMYSSSGALAFACILLFLIGIIFIFKRLGSSKIVPIYDEIPEDLLQSDVAINRPVVSPQKCGYYNDNTHVPLSKQHSGNLEGSEPPPYYNDKKDYDYAYQKSDDYYLNPYNILQTTGYSDHLYHELKE
ncbi:multiple epidermal growth factor-like domains protein 10 isoform X2 [Mytilus californianus]|uniref:multiple epidermal growth factor-like domains protein 10 isoform X2 n=1 Tax=Mytilus californianus TaxID=6549 RepID=UPI0022481477|nr:multiple epidermal growth factor-like domains protein 10 isoform X2 [Mytilus californianus]